MPTYSFKCQKCSLRFEKNLKISEEHIAKCPSCESFSDKLPPQGVGMRFKASTKIPKDIDKIVGKDAERKWAEIEERNNLKQKLRKESGTYQLSRDLDGNYTPVNKGLDKDVKDIPAKVRANMTHNYNVVKNDPESKKVTIEREKKE